MGVSTVQRTRWAPAPRAVPRSAAVVLGLLVPAALTACAAVPPVGTPTAAVRVGTCKDKTTATEMISVSDVSPAVPCTGSHTLETYALARADSAITRLGPTRPGPELLAARAADACPTAPIRPYLGARDLDSQWGVSVFVKYPTRAEWAAGQRRVLCDLVVSTARADEVPQLSQPLRGIMATTASARVRLCRRGDDDRHLLTCDQPHTGERAGDVDASAGAVAQLAACRAQAEQYAERPLTAGEAAQVTDAGGAAECWITTTAPTTGTVRGGLVAR